MEPKNLISIQKYASKNKCSTFVVIKKINAGELKSIKKDGVTYIIDDKIEAPKADQKSSMRRDEFSVEDKLIVSEILNSCEYGILCLSDGLHPYGVPLNFAWFEDSIIFHGANEGKKVELISKNPRAFFNVVKPYSYIPSYFSNTVSACPATQFFASVALEGLVEIIKDPSLKARALNALMEKMQPEKMYETIENSNPIYKKMVEKTALFKLTISNINTKIKAGQNLSKESKNSLIKQLQERGEKIDLATIELMKKFS
jgi:nitroimidazol reductase NimA-like FMN-containing flavoprotein (pyridoxamine 5'-phosphate oxidase superfamily)